MERFNYASYYGPIGPLADALRENPERFWTPTKEELAQPHEYILYLGCNVLRTTHLAESIVAVLKAMEADFIAMGGSTYCCGIVQQWAGDAGAGLKIGQKTLNTFGQSGAKAVLVYCPTCELVFDEKLASGALKFDLPYQHVINVKGGVKGSQYGGVKVVQWKVMELRGEWRLERSGRRHSPRSAFGVRRAG